MNRIMTRSFFTKGLLLIALWPVSFTWAASGEEIGDSLLKHTKIGIDFGVGFPSRWAIPKEAMKKTLNNTNIKAGPPNISLGGVLGYSFRLRNNLQWGPEVGLTYGFTRRFELKSPMYNFTIEEKYLQIPVAINIKSCGSEKKGFCLASSFMLGYEFNVLLTSLYKQKGDVSTLDPTFQGDQDLKQSMTLPKHSGSIFLGGGIDLPKGFYVVAKFKAPIELLKVFSDKASSTAQLDKAFMYPVRTLNATLVELSFGVDVMQWF